MRRHALVTTVQRDDHRNRQVIGEADAADAHRGDKAARINLPLEARSVDVARRLPVVGLDATNKVRIVAADRRQQRVQRSGESLGESSEARALGRAGGRRRKQRREEAAAAPPHQNQQVARDWVAILQNEAVDVAKRLSAETRRAAAATAEVAALASAAKAARAAHAEELAALAEKHAREMEALIPHHDLPPMTTVSAR